MFSVIGNYRFPVGACDGEIYKCKSLEQAQEVAKRLKNEPRFDNVYIDETEDYA